MSSKKGYGDKVPQQQMDACGQLHTLVTLFLWKEFNRRLGVTQNQLLY
jgi:hypothetical protein